jgi:hypothetical protein
MKRNDFMKGFTKVTGLKLSWKDFAIGMVVYLCLLVALGIGQLFGY